MNISFSDFWGDGFDPYNNFFIDLLQEINPKYKVVPFTNKDTDILIYSCFGSEHHKADRAKVKKIFYTGENKRPNYNECDYSLSFDFQDYGGKNIRLPLWLMQIDWFGKENYGNPKFVIPRNELRTSRFSIKPKTKFCCIVFSNPIPNRISILQKLSKYKDIGCYGKPFGNWSYGEDEKYKVISDYKFNICFENGIYPGYYTEKIIHAKVAGCLPLYWADEKCSNDFNTKSFLNLNDFTDMDSFVDKIIELDNDQEKYNRITNEYLFEGKEPSLDELKIALEKIL
jgi:hypothetical protein